MPIRAGIGSPRTHLSTRYLSNHPIRRTVPIGGPLGTSTGYGGGHDRDQSRKTKLRIRSLILLSSGGCFALRDLCEPRHHRCGIAMQDLRARILADLRFRKRLVSPLAAEFGPSVPHTIRSAPFARLPTALRPSRPVQQWVSHQAEKELTSLAVRGYSSGHRKGWFINPIPIAFNGRRCVGLNKSHGGF